MADDIESRLARLERHLGVSALELRWKDYVDEYRGTGEIVEYITSPRPAVVVEMNGLPRKTDWKLGFDELSVSPNGRNSILVTARAPEGWRERLDDE